ncbi:MAG: hypothetical protein DCO96_09050 [Fluviicola sp. XM-24bin1]|nr:MAG: hypothetical protein DCO96_09050 [Fluviicola sp. XM-24bin1]
MFPCSGARKKKGLTDLVEIIPFPEQLRERAPKPKQKASTPPKRPVALKPEPKVMSAPSGNLSSSSISIKKLMHQNSPENGASKIDMSNMPMNDFGMDELKMMWRRFAFDMKNQGKQTFFSALMKRDPILIEGTKYRMEVDNQTQIDYINPILSDLVDYLRAGLKNYALEISLELTSNPEEEVKFLSGKDKFAALARKNPNLHTLKSTFNLDIDF